MPQNNISGSPLVDLIPMLSIGIMLFALLTCLACLPRIRESVTARFKEGQQYLYGAPEDEEDVSEADAPPSTREMDEFDRSIFSETED